MNRYIDAVSKAEVLETYAELYDVFDDYKNIKKELNKVYDKLNALPTADVVEQKRGRWIVDEDGNIECSVCGHHGVGDLYCERCGARMEG